MFLMPRPTRTRGLAVRPGDVIRTQPLHLNRQKTGGSDLAGALDASGREVIFCCFNTFRNWLTFQESGCSIVMLLPPYNLTSGSLPIQETS